MKAMQDIRHSNPAHCWMFSLNLSTAAVLPSMETTRCLVSFFKICTLVRLFCNRALLHWGSQSCWCQAPAVGSTPWTSHRCIEGSQRRQTAVHTRIHTSGEHVNSASKRPRACSPTFLLWGAPVLNHCSSVSLLIMGHPVGKVWRW